MVSLNEAIRSFIEGVECQILANNPFVNGSAFNLRPEAREVFNDRIKIARRLRGCDPIDDPETPPPPFEGGQCNEEIYAGVIEWESGPVNSPSVSARAFVCRGPVVGAFANGGPSSPVGVGITARGAGLTGQQQPSCPVFPPATGLPIEYRPFVNGARNPRIVSLIACGQDNCGDPAPIYPPPTTINIDTDITYNIEGDTEVTVNVPFIFAPIKVNIDGSLRIPFTFDLGGFTLSGNFTLAPEVNVTINPPRMPTGEGQDTEDFEPGPPDETVEPVPPDEKIIGVVVLATLAGEQRLTTIATNFIPDIFAPRAGSIKFAYSFGATTFWSDDIDVKGARSFIPCPFSQGADAVAVSEAPGVVVTWREIRGFPLATVADLK